MKILTKWYWVLVTIFALAWIRVEDPFLIESMRLNYFDSLQRQHEPVKSSDILLVNVDEKAIQEFGQWSWARDIFADRLDQTSPSSINIFTIIYSEPDRFDKDQFLAESLSTRVNILASAPTSQLAEGSAPHVGTAVIGGDPFDYVNSWAGIVSPLTVLSDYADGVGVAATMPDIDGVIRTVPLVVSANDYIYPSLALETIRVAAGDISYQMKVGEAGIQAVRIPKYETVSTLGDGSIYVSYWNEFDSISVSDITEENTEGKFLIWGVTAEGVANPVPTSVGAMYPNEIQANIIQTLLNGNTIVRPDYADVLEIAIVILISLVVLLLVYKAKIWLVAPLVALFIGGCFYYSQHLWASQYLLLDAVFPALSLLIVFAHSSFGKFIDEFLQKQLIKKQFGTYVNPTIVERLQKDPSLIKLGGERKEVSVVMTDMRNFTALGESYGDRVEEFTAVMNKYMTAIAEPVFENDGTLIKFIGDASMHIHGAPIDDEKHAVRAVKTTLEMIEAVEKFNETLAAEGKPPVGMGAGVNTGEVIVGNIGAEKKLGYDVLGDTVSVAARVEGQTKAYGVLIIIGPKTAELVKDEYPVFELDCIAVKGKTIGLNIYTIEQETPEHRQFLEYYYNGDWELAIQSIEKCTIAAPKMYKYYEQMKLRLSEGVPSNWDGTYRATSK
jgi:adenylate cyclase